MPAPWEEAMARKTLRRADLYQPGSSPDFHAGALLGQPPSPSFLWKPTAISVSTVWPMDDLDYAGLLTRPAKSQILILGAQKYALKNKKISVWFCCTRKCVSCVRVQGGATSPSSSICILKAEAARLLWWNWNCGQPSWLGQACEAPCGLRNLLKSSTWAAVRASIGPRRSCFWESHLTSRETSEYTQIPHWTQLPCLGKGVERFAFKNCFEISD